MIEQSEIKKLINEFKMSAINHSQESANAKKDDDFYFHGACYFAFEHVVKKLEQLTEEVSL